MDGICCHCRPNTRNRLPPGFTPRFLPAEALLEGRLYSGLAHFLGRRSTPTPAPLETHLRLSLQSWGVLRPDRLESLFSESSVLGAPPLFILPRISFLPGACASTQRVPYNVLHHDCHVSH